MIVIGAFALLLLTAAIVVLYAMIGELASRIPDPDAGDDRVMPLSEFRGGVSPTRWPDGLASLADQRRMVLMVLSPVCATCAKVAAELARYQPDELGELVGVVVSCSTRELGEEFVGRNALDRFPHLVDEGGEWVNGNFGVNMSPSGLLFEEGVLTDAYTFGKVEALLRHIARATEGVS